MNILTEAEENELKTKYIQVEFSSLKIGDTFYVYGDQHINYNYPKWCECNKDSFERGQEVDGIKFLMNHSDKVFVKKI